MTLQATDENYNKQFGSIVRIIATNPKFDWFMPFKIAEVRYATGSGFFIDEHHILTCCHVVERASNIEIEIPLIGRRTIKAEVKCLCYYFDIALLYVKDYTSQLFLPLSDKKEEEQISQGDVVTALGFPLGQNNIKATRGIISGQQLNYYQIDAAINPGSSGGCLLKGDKVIGITAAGIMESQNVGYAIPIHRFLNLRQQMYQPKHVLLNFPEQFGFEYQLFSEDMKTFFGSTCEKGGILIKDVYRGTPIAKTHLKKGDVLCSINEIAIDYYGELDKTWMGQRMTLQNYLASLTLHDQVTIRYWNGKQIKTEHFVLDCCALPIRLMFPVYEKIAYVMFGGIILTPLTLNLVQSTDANNNLILPAQMLKYNDLKNRLKPQIVISKILPSSYVSNLKILEDYDIITKINDCKIATMDDVYRVLFKTLSGYNKQQQFIKLETDEHKLCVIPVHLLLKEEQRLSKIYKYTISPIVYRLCGSSCHRDGNKKKTVKERDRKRKNKKNTKTHKLKHLEK